MLITPSPKRDVPPGDGFCYGYAGNLPVYRFDQFRDEPALVHAIFTRLGGASAPPYASLNLGHTVGDDPRAVGINHDRLYGALGVAGSKVATCHLTHGNDVLTVTAAHGGQVVGQGDAMITSEPGVFLSMRFADCVPILLHDRVRRAIGLAHAGWRGTVKNVAGAVVQAMVEGLGCSPKNTTALIGPAIGHCCYQVGQDVIQAVESAFPRPAASGNGAELLTLRDGRLAHFDLWEANRQQLKEAGVGRVGVAGLCTACHTDHFFSHRAERGRTGRFGVVIGYRE